MYHKECEYMPELLRLTSGTTATITTSSVDQAVGAQAMSIGQTPGPGLTLASLVYASTGGRLVIFTNITQAYFDPLNETSRLVLQEDGVQIQVLFTTTILGTFNLHLTNSISRQPTAGNHTYRIQCTAAGGNATWSALASIAIEEVNP